MDKKWQDDPRGFVKRHKEQKKYASSGDSGSTESIQQKDSIRAKIARENKRCSCACIDYVRILSFILWSGFRLDLTLSSNISWPITTKLRAADALKGVFSWNKCTVDALNQWGKMK